LNTPESLRILVMVGIMVFVLLWVYWKLIFGNIPQKDMK
jgi:hypothetical protein